MKVLKHQHWHFLILVILLVGIRFYVDGNANILSGELYGMSTSKWLMMSILIPILHQVYVLVCWRLELFYNSLSNVFGENGFKFYKVGFAILFLSRLLTIIFLALSNTNTLELNYVIASVIAVIFFIPAVYLFYSVKTYFGIDRAFGIDHFHPEELKKVPFVKKGIFKYSSNAMYVFGFFILWIPGLLLLSKAALLVAFFNHV